MLNRYLVIFTLLFLSSGLFAQTNLSIGLHSGILVSAFEDQDESYTAIPVGVYFGTAASDNLEIGAEANLLVSPFEVASDGDESINITQTVLGLYLRYYFPTESFSPYIRAGAGYYMGVAEYKSGSTSVDVDFKGALGFNVGAGFGTSSGIYAEFIYHIVNRELDVQGSGGSSGAGSWGGHVGFAFSIN